MDQYFIALTDEALATIAPSKSAGSSITDKDVLKESLFFRRFGTMPLRKDPYLTGVFLVQVLDKGLFESFRSDYKRYYRYIEPNSVAGTESAAAKTKVNVASAVAQGSSLSLGASEQTYVAELTVRPPPPPVPALALAVASPTCTIRPTPTPTPTPDPCLNFVAPNDVENVGWGYDQNTGADVRRAWCLSTGDNSLVVAVIGNGIDLTHPDLVNNLWHDSPTAVFASTKETAAGFNVNSGATALPPQDDLGVSTHAAGLIGAQGNNGTGITGIAWNVKLMPVRVGHRSGNNAIATLAQINEGLDYILKKKDLGVNIVAVYNSFTKPERNAASEMLKAKIALAGQNPRNILFVTAAGDNARDLPTNAASPADLDNENLISVSSYYWNPNPGVGNPSLQYTGDSNYGNTRVHLAAPGESIRSTWIGGGYETYSAKSADSAAFVTGVAVLVKARYPSYTAVQVKNKILAAVRKYPAELNSLVITGGVLDAYDALLPPPTPVQPPVCR